MKLKVGECVYLQKYEVAQLMHNVSCFPASIVDELFGGDVKFFFMSGPGDGFQFDCVFKNPQNIKWLMDQKWIVDYDDYAEMPTAELEALIDDLDEERSAEIDEFNAKDEAYRKKYYEEASEKFDQSGHKITSLEYILEAREGNIKFVFPDDCQYKTAKEKKPSFFRRLFSRSAQ